MHRLLAIQTQVRCRNTPKTHVVKAKDNHKTYTQTIVPLKNVCKGYLRVTDANSWNNNSVVEFEMTVKWNMHVDYILNGIKFTCITKVPKYLPERVCKEFNKMFWWSVEGISEFTISNSIADYVAISASLFPWIPIWLVLFIIYTRCMDDQYSYYVETVNRKVRLI